MKKFFKAIWNYLKDWKNLLGHTLVGIAIILIAAFMPVPWWGRVLILIAIIVFNIFRERIFACVFKKDSTSKKDVEEQQ